MQSKTPRTDELTTRIIETAGAPGMEYSEAEMLDMIAHARSLELALGRRDALLREFAESLKWSSIPSERDLYARIESELKG